MMDLLGPVSFSLLAQGSSNAALVTFLVYILAVFGIAHLSNKLLENRNFLSEYFLGSRSLGVWAFALTFAATSASGGSFTGFPSKIYTHGWILGLWIGSYIVVPICAMGLLGKRLNQVARISGSITVPDVIRDRFRSQSFGLLAVSLIVFFMSFNLVAQFKSGAKILNTLLMDVGAFHSLVAWTDVSTSGIGMLEGVDSAYLVCLLAFGVAVIIYTTYGGFHAVVWTDVMQGVVMVIGVVVMLPLAILQVGGLTQATEQMARMTPPRLGLAEVRVDVPPAGNWSLPPAWFTLPGEDPNLPRLFRVNTTLSIAAGETSSADLKVVELTTPEEITRQLERLREPHEVDAFNAKLSELILAQLSWLEHRHELGEPHPNRQALLERLRADLDAVEQNDVALINASTLATLVAEVTLIRDYRFGADTPGVYVTGPGPDPNLSNLPSTLAEAKQQEAEAKQQAAEARQRAAEDPAAGIAEPEISGFLPLSLAISFFFMWAISGAGQPSSMVRLMAFNNTTTLRRSIFTVALYYSAIYFPLVIIFCCARIMLPGMDLDSDRIMPQMAVTLTTNIGQGWLAGLLVAAPFAAVMSTVDSFLLMISSAMVRDIYQRNIHPEAPEKRLKQLSYLCTLLVGTGAMLGAVNPPQFLQDIIVYTGSGLAACFLAPMVFALYWPRANVHGCMAGMLAGFGTHLAMYITGWFVNGSFFKPYQLMNFDPIVLGLFVSFAAVFAVTRMTAPPDEELVRKYFKTRTPSGK